MSKRTTRTFKCGHLGALKAEHEYVDCMDCRRARAAAEYAELVAFQDSHSRRCSHITPCSFPEGSIEAIRYPATVCGSAVANDTGLCQWGHAQ